jgi:thymidine phosphorylase
MVAALGGPADVLRAPALATAPVQRDVPAPHAGWLAHSDTLALGSLVVALGGGRSRPGDEVDARVGLSNILPLGSRVEAGTPLLRVHAATQDQADAAVAVVQQSMGVADAAPAIQPVVLSGVA